MVDGEVALGRRGFCSTSGLELHGRGARTLVLREWSFGGFGPPATVSFEP